MRRERHGRRPSCSLLPMILWTILECGEAMLAIGSDVTLRFVAWEGMDGSSSFGLDGSGYPQDPRLRLALPR